MADDVMAALVAAGDLPAAAQAAHTHTHRLWGAPNASHPPTSLRDAPGPHLLGSQAAVAAALPGHDRALGLGLTEAIVRYAARHEWAVTVEDMLARRWRALFVDARAAQAMAPRVAEILREETGIDPQLTAFVALCQQYQLDASAFTFHA